MQVRSLLMVASAAILVSATAFGADDTVFQVRYASNLTATATSPATTTIINVTNTGASIGTTFAVNLGPGPFVFPPPTTFPSSAATNASVVGNGNICVNLYAFSADEQEQACCSCFLTPNALASWDVSADILANTLTHQPVNGLVIKLIATGAFNRTGTGSATAPVPCDPTTAGLPVNLANTNVFPTPPTGGALQTILNNSVLVPGMLAWARGQVTATSAGTETAFSPSTLSMPTGSSITGFLTNQTELARATSLCAGIVANGSGSGLCKGCTLGGR